MSDPGGEIGLPEPPPWAEEVDLGVFANIELPVRLVVGPAFADLEAEGRWALMRLVFASWHERPAGSLPANDRVLADAAGFGADLSGWLRVMPGVLAGWRHCADERLYFVPLAEIVAAAWVRRLGRREGNTQAQQRSRMKQELAAAGIPTARLTARGIDAFVERFRAAGYDRRRRDERQIALVSLASEFGWLPPKLRSISSKEIPY